MERKVSEFLIEKWKHGFRFYDHNNDGEITAEDFAAMADYISRKTGASDEETAKTKEEFVKWYRLIQPDPSQKLDLQAFINGGNELFKNLENLIELNRTMASDFFDRMDLNKDGKVTFEELTIFYEAAGLKDSESFKTIFKHLDKDGDGYIERDELVEDYVKFFTNPDPIEGQAYIIPKLED